MVVVRCTVAGFLYGVAEFHCTAAADLQCTAVELQQGELAEPKSSSMPDNRAY